MVKVAGYVVCTKDEYIQRLRDMKALDTAGETT